MPGCQARPVPPHAAGADVRSGMRLAGDTARCPGARGGGSNAAGCVNASSRPAEQVGRGPLLERDGDQQMVRTDAVILTMIKSLPPP